MGCSGPTSGAVVTSLKFLVVFLISLAFGCGYESCPKTKDGMINVHLVPHTHDDVGWLKTVDQYYYGSQKDITPVSVKYILDSVIPELVKDPTKRFIYVEVAFFWRWWQEQHDITRNQVRTLVHNGQLEFINGGWSMNDEAATHYNAVIDQMTWGFRKLNDTFGECARPRVAWQIDPFGHSREHANLFAQMGFDGLFFGRLDYADKAQRLKTKTMEMIWKGSDSLGKSSWLFTGALFNGYSPPRGFCFDIFCDDEPIMDNPRLHDYNVNRRVDEFFKAVKDWSEGYSTNHIMMPMGEDFNYNNARTWYDNLDKLIKYGNARQTNGSQINLFYSTPSCYLKSLNDVGQTYTTKSDDFFPYASDPHAYWTGYFTSRPALKGMIRESNNFLQVCKQLGALTDRDWTPGPEGDVSKMREVVAVAQHHDAVTGTAKQAVTFDYQQRLSEGIQDCQEVIKYAYQNLMPTSKSSAAPPELIFCPLMNTTECPITETSTQLIDNVYNPLARPVSKYVRLPVTSPGFDVIAPNGQKIETQVIPIPKPVLLIPGRKSSATYELIFRADLPPIGFKSFFVIKNASVAERQLSKPSRMAKKAFLGKGKFLLGVDRNGRIQRLSHNGNVLDVTQDYVWYEGHPGNNSEFEFRASGAYIFRPWHEKPHVAQPQGNPIVYKGPLVDEIHMNFGFNVSQVLRVYKDKPEAEIEWLVGPIPIGDHVGKEVVSRFNTQLDTKKTFYTDSNGRQLLKRERNFRPTWNLNVTEPIAGNYYPINSRIAMNDGKTFVTVLTDRSQGGSSLKDGQLEIMIHRRLLYDDAFGVGEALNEEAFGEGLVVRGKHWLQVSSSAEASAKNHRLRAQQAFMDAQISFTPTSLSFQEWKSRYNMEYSALQNPLPYNVHLLTLEEWAGNSRDSLLIRLENIFDAHEDPELSKPVTISLKDLFSGFSVTNVEETILGANLRRDCLERLTWNVEKDNGIHSSNNTAGEAAQQDKDSSKVTLGPMEIRTYIVDLEPRQ
ncbi:lysosomal alpha-mannosidase-like [Tigriopus californicus]|uniref:lysosomal alpha-mannosidase-like n=1 Tax=Tigriopus californicus TaxID=6832 RepID=UPI0027DA88DE|nr:lysosomal alpha-mannosidase-like [Tigriopus californicus]|eukprot:TCALIF_00324-PA protein Name:"Similar to MAN2B1 Lysosomal alpha-mannosidase (Macaca fascicularis)" AED:0.32 eAED:0.33 QI:0/-1/0/1/-1/1/1/0/1003